MILIQRNIKVIVTKTKPFGTICISVNYKQEVKADIWNCSK